MTGPLVASLELGGTKCIASLARDGKIDGSVVAEAIKAHNVNPEKSNPAIS